MDGTWKLIVAWLGLDSDTDDGDLDKLEVALRSWGLHVLREGRRSGRAGHMWILLDRTIEADKLITLGKAMMRLAKVRPNAKDYPLVSNCFQNLLMLLVRYVVLSVLIVSQKQIIVGAGTMELNSISILS